VLSSETIEEKITRLLLEYAQNTVPERPLPPALSLRADLAIESLSLVSVALRLGEELSVDIVESGLELGRLDTVGDLIAAAHALVRTPRGNDLSHP